MRLSSQSKLPTRRWRHHLFTRLPEGHERGQPLEPSCRTCPSSKWLVFRISAFHHTHEWPVLMRPLTRAIPSSLALSARGRHTECACYGGRRGRRTAHGVCLLRGGGRGKRTAHGVCLLRKSGTAGGAVPKRTPCGSWRSRGAMRAHDVADLLRADHKQADFGKANLPLIALRRVDCMLEPTKTKRGC
jgi:hypothetical protein